MVTCLIRVPGADAVTNRETRIYLTLGVTVLISSLLLWQYFHGGIPRHHILHNKDLPAISNVWGLLILPLLTWLCVGVVNRRHRVGYPGKVKAALVAGFAYGLVLAASFALGNEPLSAVMGPALIGLALFVPLYRAEYLLGFVLGMSYTFGAFLPTVFGLIVATLGFVVYHYIRPIPLWMYRKVRQ